MDFPTEPKGPTLLELRLAELQTRYLDRVGKELPQTLPAPAPTSLLEGHVLVSPPTDAPSLAPASSSFEAGSWEWVQAYTAELELKRAIEGGSYDILGQVANKEPTPRSPTTFGSWDGPELPGVGEVTTEVAIGLWNRLHSTDPTARQQAVTIALANRVKLTTTGPREERVRWALWFARQDRLRPYLENA